MFIAKYRRAVFDESVDQVLKNVCLALVQRYQINFLEIGIDKDHVSNDNYFSHRRQFKLTHELVQKIVTPQVYAR